MGAIQSSINNIIGTIGTVSAIGQHLSTENKQLKATKENTDLLQKQYQAFNDSAYGSKLLNAQAERKALASLMNAQYPGSLLKNYNPEERIQNAQRRADFYKLQESYAAAKEKELEAGIDYNYPAEEKLVHTLTEEDDK